MPTKADAARLMASLTTKEFTKFLLGDDKAVLIDPIAASSKLTKADAGRVLDATIESIHKALNKKLKVVFGGGGLRKLKTVFGGKGSGGFLFIGSNVVFLTVSGSNNTKVNDKTEK